MNVFCNGKHAGAQRPESIDGMDVDELIRGNAYSVWLDQNEIWKTWKATIQSNGVNNSSDLKRHDNPAI